ncbi:Tyrosine recombinase XerC [Klebsiella variicola]|nr:Tyrosine recombinase XerC [Klebsiella variicola]
MARSGEPHSLPGHKVSNHVCQDQRKKNRSIPISKELYEEIIALDGFKFFTDCYFQFLSVMNMTSIVLPRGQLTHVLRHTFAAHFMMSGGNILALQKILGHHDIKMTMRYAHLAPDHLETALRFNPLATMGQSSLDAAHVRA